MCFRTGEFQSTQLYTFVGFCYLNEEINMTLLVIWSEQPSDYIRFFLIGFDLIDGNTFVRVFFLYFTIDE